MRRIALSSVLPAAALVLTTLPAPAQNGWTPLFDGSSLEGWRASEHADSFSVADGAIRCDGERSHLFYVGPVSGADFHSFELEVRLLAPAGANSGIYFHTAFQAEGWPSQGFEVQVNNSQRRQGDYLEMKKTGSLYGFRNVYAAVAPDDEWFTVRVEVRGRRVRSWVDDTLVVDYREPAPLPAAWGDRSRLGHGTFALQCHDPGSPVAFRDVRVRALPVPADEPGAPEADAAFLRMLELGEANFPLVDLHAHLKGGLTLDDALELSRRTGMFLGVALNVGRGFPIEDDAGALRFLDELERRPVFVGLQGEGREWMDLVSPEVRARFDYVFTDSMTFTDTRGRRMRLWMRDEVVVGEPQAFMEMLVEKTVGVLENEPIDVYVNPTFLPEEIAGEYDALWTEARMRRVIDAAVANGVAIEIGARYRLPGERFLRLAKQAGARFTFGTNNTGADDLGDWSYPLEMQRKLGLTWEDMFVPGHGPSRAQRELLGRQVAR